MFAVTKLKQAFVGRLCVILVLALPLVLANLLYSLLHISF